MISFINAFPGAIGQGLIWGIMAIGVYITFRVLDLADLTVDGTLATGGATLVTAMTAGLNVYVALLLAFLAGCLAGLVTGFLHTRLSIPAILAGILTQLALYSINLRIMGKANQPLSIYQFDLLVSITSIQKAIIITLITVAVIIGILYWFFGTEIGDSIRATGNNANMARANGIDVNAAKIKGLVLSNGLVALSGGLLAQYQGFSDINMGRGAIVIGLAAVIIGEVIFGNLFKNFALRLTAVAIGGVIYYLVMQFVISLGLNTDDLKLLTAVIVAVFLGIPNLKKHFDENRVKM
ncbi:putative ABC transport system permease protein [Acetitomaculum ruminis DSM 5522]|uniref:Putative ABC transport system permease protein n=1 Tax=Acetitomaculum ruminis DSM 5522 TaxID=1120918 RepID=A0A1I0YNR0_9FIRM|nr:ABC transporter permease [Acetitomaculum ruminis]SFB14090.1 putative ABC transport system permease protein [Acetitomaculum ruminis DSM 5522]